MLLKTTPLGLMIYGTLLAYLVAFVAFIAGRTKIGRVSYALGFGVALIAFGLRWFETGHVPLQSMFEVFLCLGLLSFPLSEFFRRYLDVGGQAGDALVGFAVLFPAGFVFSGEPRQLPPALQSPFFIPHVLAYMVAYVVLFKAAIQAAGHLFHRQSGADGSAATHEVAAFRTIRLGLPMLTLGLVLGACWGKMAWGDYWNWDPKELWSLATWLVYMAYVHFRSCHGRKYPRVNCTLVLVGTVFVILTLLWVNLASRLFGGLHTYAAG